MQLVPRRQITRGKGINDLAPLGPVNVALGSLLAFSYLGIEFTEATMSAATNVIIKVGAFFIIGNFLLLAAVLYMNWEPS